MVERTLGSCNPGSIVTIGSREYIVLDHYNGGTCVITKNSVVRMAYGNNGDYESSDVRRYCNDTFYNELAAVVGAEHIFKQTISLMADDGSGRDKYVEDYIGLITLGGYRKYSDFLCDHNEVWWTATRKSYRRDGWADDVCFVLFDGVPDWCHSAWYSYGVRPFCYLDSSILVFLDE